MSERIVIQIQQDARRGFSFAILEQPQAWFENRHNILHRCRFASAPAYYDDSDHQFGPRYRIMLANQPEIWLDTCHVARDRSQITQRYGVLCGGHMKNIVSIRRAVTALHHVARSAGYEFCIVP